ncbi:MAG TPA: hypothetical protein VFL86_13720 [Burkholderiaceae bacterium]|nr:hypothetical protein [Burkholderiaceae bacterium]
MKTDSRGRCGMEKEMGNERREEVTEPVPVIRDRGSPANAAMPLGWFTPGDGRHSPAMGA